MRNPDKYNFHGFLFVIAICVGGLAVVYLQGDEYLKKIVFRLALMIAAVAFAAGCLFRLSIWLKGDRRPEDAVKEAQVLAAELLDKVAGSKVGGYLTGSPGSMVLLIELMKKCGSRERQEFKDRLDELYKRVPACQLPRSYGAADETLLDWHEYDLCIVAAKEDEDFATNIKAALTLRKWRVYLDVDGEIGGQNHKIERVFKKSSWKCLGLLSVYMIRDRSRIDEFQHAMAKAHNVDDESSHYLLPIPMDEDGLRYMRKEIKYLRKYTSEARVIARAKLHDVIMQRLRALEADNHIGTRVGDHPLSDEPPDKAYAVAISYAGESREYVGAVAEDTEERAGRGEGILRPSLRAYTRRPGSGRKPLEDIPAVGTHSYIFLLRLRDYALDRAGMESGV